MMALRCTKHFFIWIIELAFSFILASSLMQASTLLAAVNLIIHFKKSLLITLNCHFNQLLPYSSNSDGLSMSYEIH